MKRFALYIGLTATLAASCSTKEIDFQTQQPSGEVFYADFEQPAEYGTRVYVNEDLLLRWTADDRVSIFNRNTYNQQYEFTGETGDNAGGFKPVGGDDFYTGNSIPNVVSVYPYLETTKISESGVLTLNLPAEQHYAEHTFGLGANTMVSVSSDNFLQYKNVGGYLVLKLYGDGVSVSSITLKGNNGEKLAGKATVTMPIDGVPSLEMASDATGAITLVCDTPVTLGASAGEGKDFWFVVPPITFSKGFSVCITQITSDVYEKSTSKSIIIERSKLSKMSPMEVEGGTPVTPGVPDAIDLGLPSGLKWASFNLGASKPEEYGDYYAWGETEPKDSYSWSNYKWCVDGNDFAITKYCVDSRYGFNGFTDGETILHPQDDAAHMNLGGKWRMPMDSEWAELLDNCSSAWTTENGVYGCLLTSNYNGNCIFLPAAGCKLNTSVYNAETYCFYWSSSLDTSSSDSAMAMFYSIDEMGRDDASRYGGPTIRPVYGDFPNCPVQGVSLDMTELELVVGESAVLTASVFPENATDKSVVWSSSNGSVATVSPSGVTTGVSLGSAIITATTIDGGKTATCNVTVTDRPVPETIDLGLPSGLKWASFNLGATKPEEYGDYYAWGETEPYYNTLNPLIWKEGKESGYTWSSYKWCMGDSNPMILIKYCTDASYGYNGFTDGKTVLDPEDDAVIVNLGGNWRMPTDEEWGELLMNCTLARATLNGVSGCSFTSKINGNSIFFPCSGYLAGTEFVSGYGQNWCSSLSPDNPLNAWSVVFDYQLQQLYAGRHSFFPRDCGYSIRPVSE